MMSTCTVLVRLLPLLLGLSLVVSFEEQRPHYDQKTSSLENNNNNELWHEEEEGLLLPRELEAEELYLSEHVLEEYDEIEDDERYLRRGGGGYGGGRKKGYGHGHGRGRTTLNCTGVTTQTCALTYTTVSSGVYACREPKWIDFGGNETVCVSTDDQAASSRDVCGACVGFVEPAPCTLPCGESGVLIERQRRRSMSFMNNPFKSSRPPKTYCVTSAQSVTFQLSERYVCAEPSSAPSSTPVP